MLDRLRTSAIAAALALAVVLAGCFAPLAARAEMAGNQASPLGGVAVAGRHRVCYWVFRHHHRVRVCRWR